MNLFWKIIAWIVARPRIANWLIQRAMKTPYQHILSPDHSEVYMYRFWLFNGYLTQAQKDRYKAEGKKLPWRFPYSIRLHRIMVPDLARHKHDHPSRSRSIILKGWYDEERLEYQPPCAGMDWSMLPEAYHTFGYHRAQGSTAVLELGEFHNITRVPDGGVWTMFITGPRAKEDWGYLVDGKKVSFREYVREGTVVDNVP